MKSEVKTNSKQDKYDPQRSAVKRAKNCFIPFYKELFHILLVFSMIIPLHTEKGFAFESNNQVEPSTTNWDKYSYIMHEIEENEKQEGLSYIISGGLLLLGSGIGLANAHNTIEKSSFYLIQGLSTIGIGYGMFKYNIGGFERNLADIMKDLNLTPQQREKFLFDYTAHRSHIRHQTRNIQMTIFTLMALTSLFNASLEKDPETKKLFYILGGTNAIFALSFAF